jgi:hypothetical protein
MNHPTLKNCAILKLFISTDGRRQCTDIAHERHHSVTHGEEARCSNLQYQHTCRHTRSTTVCEGTQRISCGYKTFKKKRTQNRKIIRSYQNISPASKVLDLSRDYCSPDTVLTNVYQCRLP